MRDTELYKRVIDELVSTCRDGQGTVRSRRVREGVWHRNATEERAAQDPYWAEQLAFNELVGRVSNADRELMARMLEQSFEAGVHAALVTLHEHEVEPFDDGFEGDPFHDFVGRLDGWAWPTEPSAEREAAP